MPFFSINGSEFIQMFVGVGAGRVRNLFNTAKENAPAILFIDEIDAVGRHRGAGVGGGHDEREQTLNQILSEMDGFTQTNRSSSWPPPTAPTSRSGPAAPGRFDRHITVDRPTLRAAWRSSRSTPRKFPWMPTSIWTAGGGHRRPDRRRHPQPGQRSRTLGQPPRQGLCRYVRL